MGNPNYNNKDKNKQKQNIGDVYRNLSNDLKYQDLYLKLDDEESKSKIDLILKEIDETFVKGYVKNINSSQMRNIFHKIKSTKSVIELKLLRPNLSYIASRIEDRELKSQAAIKFIDDLITKVDDSNLNGFKKFMEIVIAYHK
jgi:CRISPR-associated protein Csm2